MAVNLDPTKTWWASINAYSGMNWEQFKATKTGDSSIYGLANTTSATPVRRELLQNLPDMKDWRAEGMVTPVKNQEDVSLLADPLGFLLHC